MTNDKIEVFRELRLRTEGDPATIRAAVLAHLQAPWSHDAKLESKFESSFDNTHNSIVLSWAGTEDLPAAHLFLLEEASGYAVTNIVPVRVGSIGISVYNRLLQIFADQASKAANEAGFKILLTGSEQSLEEWLEPEAAILLRSFSGLANMSTRAAHPLDQKRWFDFIIAVHRSQADRRIDAGRLTRWLNEAEGWDEAGAQELASEYSRSLELLEQYDAKRK